VRFRKRSEAAKAGPSEQLGGAPGDWRPPQPSFVGLVPLANKAQLAAFKGQRQKPGAVDSVPELVL
jgi:hypothetical protein